MEEHFILDKKDFVPIGNGYSLKPNAEKTIVRLRYNGHIVSDHKLVPQIEKRLFVVDLVENKGVTKTKLAAALSMSRQSIDNWVSAYRTHGSTGLINNTKDSWKKNPKRFTGNKARQLESQRKENKLAIEKQQIAINFEQETVVEEKHCGSANELYAYEHDYHENRYAGSLLYLSVLIGSYGFLKQLSVSINKYLWIPLLFVMMHINKIASVEQLKTVFKDDFGQLMGIKRLPNLVDVRENIRSLAQLKLSDKSSGQFFKLQVIKGVVSIWRLFLDGHFVPYSGKEKVHKAHSTQRDLMMPGQTEFFSHDSKGKIVYFDIREGQGNMLESFKKISNLGKNYNAGTPPLIVVDRELWGVDKFISLSGHRFVTWEKNSNKESLRSLPDESFEHSITVGKKSYTLFEVKKTYKNNKGASIDLRRIIARNIKTGETFAIVTNDELEGATIIADSMLNRWGNSENGFKHLGTRTNMHYNPAWEISEESHKQEVPNPEHKAIKQKESALKTSLARILKQLGKKEITLRKDGTPRESIIRQRLIQHKEQLEKELKQIKEKLSACAPYINLKQTGNQTFKVIDKEGKTWWNIAQMIFWNSRKILASELYNFLSDERDLLPLLDAITSSRGWIKNTKDTMIVRIEPLETPRFKSAQIQLCRYLNGKETRLPNGKLLQYDVATDPYSVQK